MCFKHNAQREEGRERERKRQGEGREKRRERRKRERKVPAIEAGKGGTRETGDIDGGNVHWQKEGYWTII